GASVNAGGGTNASGFGGRALAEDLALVLDILSDMVMRPHFPATEIERLRSQLVMGLRESEQETRTQASRAARELLFPADHPYSRLSGGTIETVSRITRDDLRDFHALYQPAASTIAIVGDVQPSAVLELLERSFGAWHAERPLPATELPPPNRIERIERRDIAMAGKTQSDVIWAVHGLPRTSPDYYAAAIGNMMLGRIGLGGRLGENVRERQGLAYYCGSSLDADLYAGPWAALAGINPANVERTIAAIVHEVAHFLEDGPTDQELSDTRDYMTGSTVLGLETNDGIAATLLGIERYNLGLDYIDRYPSIIRSVTPEQIVEVARRYLSTERYVVTVAGPGAP
ncbi:MAG TPA: pitrilysin family protein, partial [Roseiflexaceae bacterium]|nr:pitrilysin family protein [Roseiflexaceae bacterium]